MNEAHKYYVDQMNKKHRRRALMLRAFFIYVSLIAVPLAIISLIPVSFDFVRSKIYYIFACYTEFALYVMLPALPFFIICIEMQPKLTPGRANGEIIALGVCFAILMRFSEQGFGYLTTFNIPGIALLFFPISIIAMSINSNDSSTLLKRYRERFEADYKEYMYPSCEKFYSVQNELDFIEKVVERKRNNDTSEVPKEMI